MPEKEHVPYKAINVFIDRDYLEKVIREILEGIAQFSKQDQIEFFSFFRKHVSILGFRNPVRAPQTLQINAYATAFEEKDEVIPFTLSTWTKIKADFAEVVSNWLVSEGWKELSLARDYDENSGFTFDWPEDLTFEKIEENFKKANPKVSFDRDDLILMVLWISGTLPKEQSEL